MLEAGAHLGAYTIVRPLGAGGMGVVYLARHRHIGRDAAIKVLLPELTNNHDIVARFLTEARATAAIRHPGIVEILDCDIDSSGRAYIVMEYLRGESLANCLARARRSLSALPSVVSVGSQVASALAAAHERGIVHRDLKPDNMFLSTDGGPRTPVVIKILDFGIAKLVSGNNEGNTHKTRTGSMLGTPAYMSPEQARDASAIDDRADIYALGCILFEMVAGRPPFVRPGAGEVMIAHVIEPPPKLSSLVPEVDPTLEALVSQMLEKDPAGRPQTMTEVQSRLDALVAGRPAPLMTAIMPTVDSGQVQHTLSSTPAPGGTPSGGATARAREVPLEIPREISSPSGRMVPGGTLLMPVAATTTHSTTMSDSAAEVSASTTKTVSSRRNPLVVGGAIAAVGLIVVVAVFAFGSGPAPTASPPSAPIAAAPPAPAPRVLERTPPRPAPPPPSENPPPVETAAVTQEETARPAVAEEKPKQILIQVDSDPSDAEVWLPDEAEARGRTPFKVALNRGASPTRIVLKVHGYADRTVKLDPAKPGPVRVTLDRVAREKTASSSGASNKKKGFDITGGKPNGPSGYKMMGD